MPPKADAEEETTTKRELPPRPVIQFDMDKHKYETKNHPMSGIIFPQWIEFLLKYGRKIDWLTYWPRVLFLTFMSIFNGLFSLVEALWHDPTATVRTLHPEPVFIIGHPRTGTTHIHNLLSHDKTFIFANTLHVGFPKTFFAMEKRRKMLEPLISETRPMDNMRLTWDLPQEDELATQLLTSGLSPYMPLQFMRDYHEFFKYLTFETASKKESMTWIREFLFFLKKVTYRYCGKEGPSKPMLIKSPVHTGRIRLLLQLFPKAKFIYMHRNPYEVFQSACNMAEKFYGYCALQKPTSEDITNFIIDQYELFWDLYSADRSLIPKENLIEVGFEDLEKKPLEQLHRIYRFFGWSKRFTELKPVFEEYCKTLEDFKKNDHKPIDPVAAEYISKAWIKSFTDFGYNPKILPDGTSLKSVASGAGAESKAEKKSGTAKKVKKDL